LPSWIERVLSLPAGAAAELGAADIIFVDEAGEFRVASISLLSGVGQGRDRLAKTPAKWAFFKEWTDKTHRKV
jgi:hypothetical protein